MNKILLFLTFLLTTTTAFGQYRVRGYVVDQATGEYLTGAHVTLSNVQRTDVSSIVSVGLDGRFSVHSLPAGDYQLKIEYIGYEILRDHVKVTDHTDKTFELRSSSHTLDAVDVRAQSKGTDIDARRLERISPNVINVISAKQIELSPDITVANVVQRVSGLSIERNANGDPQYAVVRGMNKRYNNTLVNGIKIPSPDNDNRFVPLDIFPAVFLERLEVSKSLSAEMEADAIGGTIDMIMKSAPSTGRIFEFDVQTGANVMNLDEGFTAYDRSQVYKKSPAERYGANYEAVPADFPTLQFEPKNKPLLDILASGSYGQRFLDNKLGLLIGGSYQSSFRPNESYFYDPSVLNWEGNPLKMNKLIERRTSTEQQRVAFHAKLDYDLNDDNSFAFYGGHYNLNEFRVREQYLQDGQFTTPTGFNVYPMTRITNTYQTISIANLSGLHQFTDELKLDWKGVYSIAKNELPDDAIFMRTGKYEAATDAIVDETPTTFTGSHNSRWWERNQDNDLALYLNTDYKPADITYLEDVRVGGMVRTKNRDNNMIYYKYTAPLNMSAVRGVDWMYFGDIAFDPISGLANGYGDGNGSNMIYDADETVVAYYANTKWKFSRLHIQAGLRGEHTIQGYFVDNSAELVAKDNLEDRQNYFNLFPSFGAKFALTTKAWLKATYYKGISRPGFYEIIPTTRAAGGGDSFYSERGNPDLKPTIGHSFDIRYELFPNVLDQFFVGLFYKKLIDPIEYGFPQVENADARPNISRILPQNFGTAENLGIEVDYTKYIRAFGIRMNYTYTNSSITTNKIVENEAGSATPFNLVNESRPLQGQSDHVGNLSLLYKNMSRKIDAQLVLNYTGKRLAVVSPYEGTDQYMNPMAVLDFSLEKGFGKTVVFLKANNLLDTPYQLVINKPIGFSDDHYRHQDDQSKSANIRRDLYGQSFRLGVRYKL